MCFARGATLDLALYESVNAVWKEYKLLKAINEDVALKLISVMRKVFSVIDVLSAKGSEKETFELALKEGITVYDASYIYVASKGNLVLVTDDVKLRERARKYVDVLRSRDLL